MQPNVAMANDITPSSWEPAWAPILPLGKLTKVCNSSRINGELIDSLSGIHIGNSTTHNLSINAWEITSGKHTLDIEIYDGFGKLIDSESETIIIKYSGWNIGISSIEISSDNQDLTINMRRQNYEQLLDVHLVH